MARIVLLADDSVTAQNMGRRILIDAGYDVVTVNNGSAALKKVHESRPDLIVLDVYMPGYGGLEVCQRLKETEETAKIPILLTVGKMEPFKPEEARRARADGHIVKPFEASELLAALTRLEERIVPQPEPSRARKGKSEKKVRSWRGGDPVMSYDDTQSEKIAYLAEVKQRRFTQQDAVQAEDSQNSHNSVSIPSAEDEIAAAPAPKPRMAMPMSVYAAEQLQELPVVAAPPELAEDAEVPTADHQEQPAAAPQEQVSSAQQVEGDGPQGGSDREEKSAAVAETESVQVESAPSTVTESAQPMNSEGESSFGSAELVAENVEPEVEDKVGGEEEGRAKPAKVAATGRWVAENVAVTADEAALELEREMHEVRAQSTAPADSSPGTPPEAKASESVSVESPAPEEKGATFAAAASASGSGAVGTSIPQTEAEPSFPSETAAAWENWKQIRDSVMGSQTAVRLSDSVAEAVKANATESAASADQAIASTPAPQSSDAAAADTPADTPAEADADNAALSSIVDSVLAELKPKLMQEISRKLKK